MKRRALPIVGLDSLYTELHQLFSRKCTGGERSIEIRYCCGVQVYRFGRESGTPCAQEQSNDN
jgi:hypothetical protein